MNQIFAIAIKSSLHRFISAEKRCFATVAQRRVLTKALLYNHLFILLIFFVAPTARAQSRICEDVFTSATVPFHNLQSDDPYAVLGLQRTVSLAEVQKAFRLLSRIYHPDLNDQSKQSKMQFQKLNWAIQEIKRRRAKEELNRSSAAGPNRRESARGGNVDAMADRSLVALINQQLVRIQIFGASSSSLSELMELHRELVNITSATKLVYLLYDSSSDGKLLKSFNHPSFAAEYVSSSRNSTNSPVFLRVFTQSDGDASVSRLLGEALANGISIEIIERMASIDARVNSTTRDKPLLLVTAAGFDEEPLGLYRNAVSVLQDLIHLPSLTSIHIRDLRELDLDQVIRKSDTSSAEQSRQRETSDFSQPLSYAQFPWIKAGYDLKPESTIELSSVVKGNRKWSLFRSREHVETIMSLVYGGRFSVMQVRRLQARMEDMERKKISTTGSYHIVSVDERLGVNARKRPQLFVAENTIQVLHAARPIDQDLARLASLTDREYGLYLLRDASGQVIGRSTLVEGSEQFLSNSATDAALSGILRLLKAQDPSRNYTLEFAHVHPVADFVFVPDSGPQRFVGYGLSADDIRVHLRLSDQLYTMGYRNINVATSATVLNGYTYSLITASGNNVSATQWYKLQP